MVEASSQPRIPSLFSSSRIRESRRWIAEEFLGIGRGRRRSPVFPPPPSATTVSIFFPPPGTWDHLRPFAGEPRRRRPPGTGHPPLRRAADPAVGVPGPPGPRVTLKSRPLSTGSGALSHPPPPPAFSNFSPSSSSSSAPAHPFYRAAKQAHTDHCPPTDTHTWVAPSQSAKEGGGAFLKRDSNSLTPTPPGRSVRCATVGCPPLFSPLSFLT